MHLTEKYKSELQSSHHQLGKGKPQLISNQLNSYLTIMDKPTYSDGKLKNSSINFNPRSVKIKGKI